jgi:uncharacterized protein YjiK
MYRFSFLFTASLIALCCFASCGPRATSIVGTTEGYDLEHPQIIDLPTALDEISGLYFYAKDTSLFAITDEDGFLYKIFPHHPETILRWRFAGLGDYEDLEMVGGIFYILRSDGSIFAADITDPANVRSTVYPTPEKGNEFESLYFDSSRNMLMLVCKDCNGDGKKHLSTFGFSLQTKSFVKDPFRVGAEQIAGIIGQRSIKFKPSGATINHFSNKLMLVSAVNSLLVVTSLNGEVLQAYPLPTRLYKQPEGIALGTDRTLYISNEYHNEGAANILVIPYNAPH